MTDVNVVEIDARLQMLAAQRDQAMNQCVLLAGELARVRNELDKLKESLAADAEAVSE